MRIGIAIDPWKKEIFHKHLIAAGFTYTEGDIGINGVKMLYVDTDNVDSLAAVIKSSQLECIEFNRNRN